MLPILNRVNMKCYSLSDLEQTTFHEVYMVWQTRLSYDYTVRYCIDIEKIATILCVSRSNSRFARYFGNSRNCLKLLD